MGVRILGITAALIALAGCGPSAEPAAPNAEPQGDGAEPSATPDPGAVRERARAVFGVLPAVAESPKNPVTEEKIELGRLLYHDPRLSKNHDVSCASCHRLDAFGVDGEVTSPGHRGQRGGRNSPTVYNAAFHIAQFWDGRAADVEEQAKGPVLNPVEMAMPDEATVVAVLRSIPAYPPLFATAFPGPGDPVTYDHMARAIGAFERRLVTPGRFDGFLEGDLEALDDREVAGLAAFMDTGCISCHMGPTLGGSLYQKLGLVKPYPTEDAGRFDVTGVEADRGFFKVPSLRNVAETGPYFHDGSIAELDEAIRIMALHQLGTTLDPERHDAIAAFLASLTGEVDADYVSAPELPPSGPETPAPDPS
jgi:cytochrome c peroxidase